MALQHGTPARGAFVVNVMVLGAVFVFLAVSPAPVSFPESPWETGLLATGAVALLLVNALLIRPTRDVPRAPVAAHTPPDEKVLDLYSSFVDYEVVDGEHVVGITDEVLVTRDGRIVALSVKHGFLRTRRFAVTPDEIRSLDHANRAIYVGPSSTFASATDDPPEEEQ